MQVRQGNAKPKYNIANFIMPGNCTTHKVYFTSKATSCRLHCLCGKFSQENSLRCSRCFAYVHNCLEKLSAKSSEWECLHCTSVFMDPVFSVKDILLETMFKTQSIFQCLNQIEFEFRLTAEQLVNPVEVRGLKYGREGLAWPMQGELYLNKHTNPQPFFSFKPLMSNSNRKNRKEEPLMLPPGLLSVGKNVLEFRIPRLNSKQFTEKYQYEITAEYFFGIYSIKKMGKDELVLQTFKKSKIEKEESLKLLRELTGQGDQEIVVEKIKLNLECPYSKQRIKVPIRGKKCLHYTCMCLETLIQTRVSMTTREWNCPICGSKVNEPVIDMFVFSILNDGTGGVQIFLTVTGEYTWLEFNPNSDSDDESIKMRDDKPKAKPAIAIEQKANSEKNVAEPKPTVEKKAPIEIDLDDDEPQELPPPVTPPPVQIVSPVQPAAKKPVPSKINVPPPFEIIVPKDVPPSRQEAQEKNRQRVREAMKKKREHNKSPEKQFLVTDVKPLEFKAMNLKEYMKNFHIEYQPRANKTTDELNLMFSEFRQIL